MANKEDKPKQSKVFPSDALLSDKVWPNDWSQMGLVGGKEIRGPIVTETEKKVALRLNKDDGPLTSNPVSDGGVGGTFGPRADPEVLDTHRKNAKKLAMMLVYQGSQKGGVNSIDELLTVLRYFPMGLLSGYLRLIDASVGETNMGSGRGGDDTVVPGVGKKTGPRIKTGSAEKVLSARKKRTSSSGDLIKDHGVLGYRRRVDRRLRKIAREINAHLAEGGDVAVNRRCGGTCKRVGDGEWLYCPWCAGPMEETENRKAKK